MIIENFNIFLFLSIHFNGLWTKCSLLWAHFRNELTDKRSSCTNKMYNNEILHTWAILEREPKTNKNFVYSWNSIILFKGSHQVTFDLVTHMKKKTQFVTLFLFFLSFEANERSVELLLTGNFRFRSSVIVDFFSSSLSMKCNARDVL